jgi:hypothetical protein
MHNKTLKTLRQGLPVSSKIRLAAVVEHTFFARRMSASCPPTSANTAWQMYGTADKAPFFKRKYECDLITNCTKPKSGGLGTQNLFIPPLFIEVHVQSKESQMYCICMLEI